MSMKDTLFCIHKYSYYLTRYMLCLSGVGNISLIGH